MSWHTDHMHSNIHVGFVYRYMSRVVRSYVLTYVVYVDKLCSHFSAVWSHKHGVISFTQNLSAKLLLFVSVVYGPCLKQGSGNQTACIVCTVCEQPVLVCEQPALVCEQPALVCWDL